MTTSFSCSACGQPISTDVTPGRQVQCPFCDAVVIVPGGPAPPPVGTASAAPYPHESVAPRTGLAIGALVCAIVGLVGCWPLAVVGLILGIVALTKINANPRDHGGKGMAIAGICIGGIGIVVIPVIAMLISILLPSLSRARELSKRVVCAANLKGIGISAQIYANESNGQFPADLQVFVDSGEMTPKQLVCPSTGVAPGDISACYIYIAGQTSESDGRNVLAYEKPENHGEGGTVVFVDGRCEFIRPYSRVEELVEETRQRITEAAQREEGPDPTR